MYAAQIIYFWFALCIFLIRKAGQLQCLSNNLRNYHREILADWKIVTAISASDIVNVEHLFEEIGKTKYMPCSCCLPFVISASTDLGMQSKSKKIFR
jgi:hypothetical protein